MKRNETKARKTLKKNGKYFVPPPRDDSNIKELFLRLAATGAGRTADDDGFPSGPWTPELLADAISQIQANQDGVDLRTVQLWFQDNEKGIGIDNIRWLARVFGCDDPQATSDWQIALTAAQSRLTAIRRERKKAGCPDEEAAPQIVIESTPSTPKQRFSLAQKSEGILSRGSPLDVPASVFAGAVALGFSSYFLGIYSVSYARADGITKQVGFLWAPNWTLLFMVFMPLFFACVVELLGYWKNEGRPKLLADDSHATNTVSWAQRVEASSYTYWAVFSICLVFAGFFQWVGVRLTPLTNGVGDYAIDWGTLALVRPDVISIPQAIAFTGFAYLYMCLCFYVFFVGLILLYTLAHDLWDIGHRRHAGLQHTGNEVGLRVMQGIFRCTIAGILVAICMKLQSFFLTSDGANVLSWLFNDMVSVLGPREPIDDATRYSRPTHYSSLLITLATCFVFLYGAIRIAVKSRFDVPLGKMPAVVTLLTVSYLMIGAFPGFSILLSVGILVAIYGLFDPAFGTRPAHPQGDNQSVS